MDKISVVIPVYNGQDFLADCIDSVCHQTYDNLEIIIINDGSTDGTAALIETYKAQDNRIRVLHKSINQGLSAARNSALEMVTGDYLVFIDSDDWVDKDHIESMYELLVRTDSDIAISNFSRFYQERQTFQIHLTSDDYYEKVFSPQEWFDYQYGKAHNLSLCFTVPWTKLYKTSLFEFIEYPVGKHAEDDFTTWKLYLLSDKIAYMNRSTYIYRVNESSMTQTASQDTVFPTEPIFERLAVLSLLGFDTSKEIDAYEWRAKIGKNGALESGDMSRYKKLQFHLNLMKKYRK